MTIDSIEIVIYTAYFIVPGFIINEIMNSIMPGKRRTESIQIIRFLAYSIFNLALWCWLWDLLVDNKSFFKDFYWLIITCFIIGTSFITGIAIGAIRKKQIIKVLLERIGFKQIEHPIPTSWDYIFSKTNSTKWVIVTLSNGKVIKGKYSYDSFASSDIEYKDIYLEEVYVSKKNKPWEKVNGTSGIWICPEEIRMIEFLEE